MSNELTALFLVMLYSVSLGGCTTLHEALYGRPNRLGSLSSATLGQTPREEIVQRFGDPDEINTRWFDSFESEVYFYHDRYTTNNNQVEDHFLACEFSKGVLTAYSFQDSSSPDSFDEKQRSQVVRGKSTRHDVESLLGIPAGKALLPTTVTLPALALKLAAAPFPMARIPENAKEAWQYYGQNLDDYLNRSAQKTLTIFFDDKGLVIGSSLLQELVTKSK